MIWTLEEEKRLAVLLSIIDIGGYGTKKRVLDNIRKMGYLKFEKKELEWKHNRPELVWRNHLAWIRKTLKRDGFIDGAIRNEWRITPTGKDHFCSEVYDRLRELTTSNPREPLKLTDAFYREIKNRIRKICPAMKENYWDRLPPEVFN